MARATLTTEKSQLLQDYRLMLLIRRFEETSAEMYGRGKIGGFLHLYIGEEAVAVGAIKVLEPQDYILTHYRDHGHALARGMDPRRLMAELFGRATGCSRGKGGSMHLFDTGLGFMGGYAIVGGQLPIATGLGLASQMRDEQRVALVIIGDGAVQEGEFHESLNLAALWKLPVVFLCENNGYGMGTPISKTYSGKGIHELARSYDIACRPQVDGMDVLAVREATQEALTHARSGQGPCFLEVLTYRFRGHSMADPVEYRSREEEEQWKQRDPIQILRRRLQEEGHASVVELEAEERAVEAEVEEAVRFADESPVLPPEAIFEDVYASPPTTPASQGGGWRVEGEEASSSPQPSTLHPPPSQVTYREAIRTTLRDLLRRDDRVFLMGEDIGEYGGAYAVTRGLLKEFGPERVRNTPIAESAIVGAGIGAAMGGMRPIVEIMTINFSLLAMDQIVNHAAKLRSMSGGQIKVPLVIRTVSGGGNQLGAQHSQSLEGWYASVPGLKVVAPATPYDARGLLLAALDQEDPVLFLEHSLLYGQRGAVPETDYRVPIGLADVKRAGRDATVITYLRMVPVVLRAAERLAQEGIEVEVVDLRSLRPLDMDTVLASVRRTSRAVVVEEAWRTGGFAAEVAARIQEEAFDDLDGPVLRVAGADVPMPYARELERAALPSEDEIVRAVKSLL